MDLHAALPLVKLDHQIFSAQIFTAPIEPEAGKAEGGSR